MDDGKMDEVLFMMNETLSNFLAPKLCCRNR